MIVKRDTKAEAGRAEEFRLVVLDPGHFHAALVQKEMYPQLDGSVAVYAPLGPELFDYLKRISLFNRRKQEPTQWRLRIDTSDDPLREMLAGPRGDVVVLAGKNRSKMERISAAISAGLNVLADKPWIISSDELPQLEEALRMAEEKGLVAYDIMTERHEVTSEITRELVNTNGVYGETEQGTEAQPGIYARSIHNVMKVVSGVPLQRPPWFFDIDEYGEGLADVGTHVVDLVQWTAFADQPIQLQAELEIRKASRWPLTLTRGQFKRVTGLDNFPEALAAHVRDDKLEYFCNNSVWYTIRGVHVQLDISWDWEASRRRRHLRSEVSRNESND